MGWLDEFAEGYRRHRNLATRERWSPPAHPNFVTAWSVACALSVERRTVRCLIDGPFGQYYAYEFYYPCDYYWNGSGI